VLGGKNSKLTGVEGALSEGVGECMMMF
jgi:hypothetical protein